MDVTVHAVTSVPVDGPSALRRKCATQYECRVQYDAPARAGQRLALRLLRFSARLRLPLRGPQYEVIAHTANAIWPCAVGMASGLLVWQADSCRRDDRSDQFIVKGV